MKSRKQRRLLDSLGKVQFETVPREQPEKRKRKQEPRQQETSHRVKHIEAEDPSMCVQYVGKACYVVVWAGRTYDVVRGRIEERVGGRWRRNLIRWLVGYVDGVRTAFLLSFVDAAPEWDGLHIWLDELIRRAGAEFMGELFRLFELKLRNA